MRNSLMIVVGISMIAAFACGGSSKSAPPTASPTPVSDEAFKAAATNAANAIQITSADLPAGWTGTPHVSSDTEFDLRPECARFNEESSPYAVVDTYSDDFADAADRSVSSQVTIYRTAELASTDSADFTDLLARCREEVARALETSIIKDAPGATARVTLEGIAANDLGGWTNGYKLSMSATSASGTRTTRSDVTVYWKMAGRVIVSLGYVGGKPIEADILDALKSLLARRAAYADAALPR